MSNNDKLEKKIVSALTAADVTSRCQSYPGVGN